MSGAKAMREEDAKSEDTSHVMLGNSGLFCKEMESFELLSAGHMINVAVC